MAETKAELEARVAELESAQEKRSIIQRLLDVARDVGVLEPARSGGVPFAFRGVDAVVATLTPQLIKHEVLVVPVGAIQSLAQQPAGNKTVTKADLTVSYRFYGPDGDYLEAEVPGQADDYADRSTAQAMSVAFRILLLQTFHIAAFGNEEQASEDTKNTRESAAEQKISKARDSGSTANPASDPAILAMRQAILAAATAKGWEPAKINEFAAELTGKPQDVWFNSGEALNLILSKINEAK